MALSSPASDALVSVLQACLRPAEPAVLGTRLALLTSDQWEALLPLAKRHGVMPLLYRQLHRSAAGTPIPPAVLQALRGEYLSNAARNTQLYQQLARVLQRLHQAGLPVVVLKGAHLAEAVWRNIALRPMGDIDVLIQRTDLPRVEAVLLAEGYRADPRNGPAVEARHLHFVYHPQGPGVPLEVHWHILPPEQADFVDLDGLWQRAVPARLGGVETLVLSPADLLLHLCLHLYHHRFNTGLRAFCDIAEVVRYYADAIDAQTLSQRLQTSTGRKVVYLGLRLAREWLEAPVSDAFLNALYAGEATEWVAAVQTQVFKPDAAVLSLGAPGLVQLWGNQPWWRKAPALLRRLFPSATTLGLIYSIPPASLRRFLFYPRYLAEVLRKFGQTAWRLAWGDATLRQAAARLDALDQWLHAP